MPKADLVLEGGGVKGLGLVGAVLHLMREGYRFQRVAGTSAGSIVAAFPAAGATADDLAAIVPRLNHSRVPDRAGLPGVNEGLALLTSSGAHPGAHIHRFVRVPTRVPRRPESHSAPNCRRLESQWRGLRSRATLTYDA
jgi:NTE family protein